MSKPLNGSLLLFGDDPAHQRAVFMTGTHQRAVVVVGSQVGDIFSLNCITNLLPELNRSGWSSAQLQLGSSMVSRIPRTHIGDAEDLEELIGLLSRDYMMREITLFGWSTGVQIVLEFLSYSHRAEMVTRVVLQGAVRDPNDDIFSALGVSRRKEAVARMVRDGRNDQLVSDDVYDIPLTAARLASGGLPSLMEAMWIPAVKKDHATLKSNLEHITVPLLIIISTAANYNPSQQLKAEVQDIVSAVAATPDVEVAFFDAASDEHRCLLRGAEALHVATVITFLHRCDRRREEREEAVKLSAAEEMRRNRSILARSNLRGAF